MYFFDCCVLFPSPAAATVAIICCNFAHFSPLLHGWLFCCNSVPQPTYPCPYHNWFLGGLCCFLWPLLPLAFRPEVIHSIGAIIQHFCLASAMFVSNMAAESTLPTPAGSIGIHVDVGGVSWQLVGSWRLPANARRAKWTKKSSNFHVINWGYCWVCVQCTMMCKMVSVKKNQGWD